MMFPPFAEMPFTYIICLLVIITSIIGFYYKPFYQFFIYHPYEVFRGKRIHTIFTSAFVHKNWWHLIFNIYIFYGVIRDVEYIILEKIYSISIIKLICLLVCSVGIVLPNIISGLKQKNNFAFVSNGFSGATFCSISFSMFYLPLDVSPKKYVLMPLTYAYEFGILGFIVFLLVALVFKNSTNTNHKLHIYAYVIGILMAILLRPILVLELLQHIKSRFN